jgi:uncharacterized protein (DUF362 family)/Pyruvate/2-oxoacid:ferredoxin oxidoreductase delta subunit
MSKVIVKEAAYHYETLKPLIFEIMDALGGNEIRQKSRVLIKPNLLAAAEPGDAVISHFMLVKAVAEYVLEKGAVPLVSDSPALGSFDKILKVSGIRDALAGLNVECREFRESLSIDVGPPFGVIELARDAVEAEMIISLPKLKTHAQMLLTLGVKNMFGCVVGFRKPEWHMKMGVNRDMFARLLVRIYERLKPSVTILDGILAMEGEGPGKRGIPRRLDLIIAGRNAFAIDAAVCRMFGLKPDMLPTLKAARELGVFDGIPEIEGTLPEIGNFKLPAASPLIFGPRIMHGFARRHFLKRPVCEQSVCLMCGKCWEFCPAGAIENNDGETLSFDYDRCIRCFCCMEVCPHGVVHLAEPLAARMLRKLTGVKAQRYKCTE